MEKKENTAFAPASCLIVLFLALFSWLFIGPLVAYYAMAAMDYLPHPMQEASSYIGLHIPYITLFLALLFGTRYIMNSSLSELVSDNPGGIRWKYAIKCGFLYLAVMAAAQLCMAADTAWAGLPLDEWASFLLPVIIMTPLQALSEEILFRALPARLAYGRSLPNTPLKAIPLTAAGAFIFMLPHLGNSEVQAASSAIIPALYYFLWGALAMLLSIATDGFEAPIAMHIANNLFIALIVNYSSSSMPTKALFLTSGTTTAFTLVEAAVVFILIYALSLRAGTVKPAFRLERRG